MLDNHQQFRKNITYGFGKSGLHWLDNLPNFLNTLAQKLNIKIQSPIKQLNFNYVTHVTDRVGHDYVLKCAPANPEFNQEIDALLAFNGQGFAVLHRYCKEQGWMLLQRLTPGYMLSESSDDINNVEIFINLLNSIRADVPEEHNFPCLKTWCRKLHELYDVKPKAFPRQLIEPAYSLYQDLMNEKGKQILLHGDLHHYNILSHQGKWLAIDPKGIIGEPEFEFAAFMRNPIETMFETQDLKRLYKTRFDVISEQRKYDIEKIKAWSYVQAILAAYWAYEDRLPMWQKFLSCATFLREYI